MGQRPRASINKAENSSLLRRIPKTRAEVVALLEKYGFDETGIERIAMETSVDTLADLQSLAFKHEIPREAMFRVLERRRKKTLREIA
jgi:hypothetical protein